MNIYSTAALLLAIQQLTPASSFLKDRYAPTVAEADLFNSEEVLVEMRDGDRRVAPFVMEYTYGVPVSRKGQTMRSYTPPTVAPSRPLTMDDITKRGFGEALFGDKSPEERAALLAARDLSELSDMITRREELMVAQALTQNAVDVAAIGDDVDKSQSARISYYNTEVHKTNPAEVEISGEWDDPTYDKIDKDIKEMILMLTENGLAATDLICSPDVAQAILDNEKIQKLLDNRRYFLGEVAPVLEGQGASNVATLNIFGYNINVIAYTETYQNDEGKNVPFMPSGSCVLTAPGAYRTVYGAVTQVEQSDGEFHTYTGARVPKFVANPTDNSRILTVTSRPLVVPNNINPAIVANVFAD